MALRTRRKRPGGPPKVWTDTELEDRLARPEELESHLNAHRTHARRLARRGDPGFTLPPAQAAQARQEHVAELERHVGEVRRVEAALEASPKAVAEELLAQHIRRSGRRMAARAGHVGEQQEFLDQLHRSLAEQAQEREARKQVRQLAERLEHPPDPRAESITAAVLADGFLFDGLRRIRREATMINEFGGRETLVSNEPVYELEDLSVAQCVFKLLEETNPVAIRQAGAGGRWPEGSALPPIQRLASRIRHLAANGVFSTRLEGGTLYVTYGQRAREIATRWGLELEAAEKKAVQA